MPVAETRVPARLVLSGNTLYGAASYGGQGEAGAVLPRIDLAPTLSIGRTGLDSLAVSWPSVWMDHVLQQNANRSSSLNWSHVTGAIQDDGANKTLFVNPIDGTRFYRLALPEEA